MRELILGGVRSGKSRYAERRAAQLGESVVYIATARSDGDTEMAARIATHRAHRPAHWTTVEAPLALSAALQNHCNERNVVIVDCLTLWLNNLLGTYGDDERAVNDALDRLATTVEQVTSPLLLVSNETGLGVIPANALARRFCDLAGTLHQALAERCEHVTFCLAGLNHRFK